MLHGPLCRGASCDDFHVIFVSAVGLVAATHVSRHANIGKWSRTKNDPESQGDKVQ